MTFARVFHRAIGHSTSNYNGCSLKPEFHMFVYVQIIAELFVHDSDSELQIYSYSASDAHSNSSSEFAFNSFSNKISMPDCN